MEQTICLQPGNVLYLYTDGVTEAENEENDLSGGGCLPQSLNDLRDKDVHSIMVITVIKRMIDRYYV